MARENLNDIVAFLAVAREKNFTKAAAKLGVSQSALSHTIRALETRLGLRLLTRTTRSVSPTEAGERLLSAVGPHFEDIQAALDALGALRDKPSGNVRITAGLHVTDTILWPKLQPMLRKYPDVNVEIMVDYGLANIVADRFDTVAPHIERGRLRQVLDHWCAPFPGYHLYFPSRRQSSSALSLVIDALRYKRK